MSSGGKKTKTTSNETATTTPNLLPAASSAIDNYYGKLGGLMDLQPSSIQTAPNAFQMQAAQQASGLLGQLANGSSSIPTTQAMTQKAALPSPYSATKVNGPAAPTAAQATLADYGPVAMAGDTSGLAGKDVATYGGASARPFMDQYLDPQIDGYVKASLANFDDQAGRQQAEYERLGALNKGIGGSSYAIGRAELDGNLTRGRALTEAELRSDAFKTALGAGQSDAANANSAGIASMQAKNQRDELQAQLAAQLGMFNAGSINDRSQSIFDAANQLGMFNTGQQNDIMSMIFGEQNANARQDAGAQNDVLSQIYGTTADMNRFNVDAYNTNQRFNADAINDNTQFNSQQELNRKNAALGAAGLLGDLGGDLYNIDRQNQLAPYTQQQILADLINGGGILGATTGQTINSNGTSTSKESGGLGASLLGGLFGLGAAAIGKK